MRADIYFDSFYLVDFVMLRRKQKEMQEQRSLKPLFYNEIFYS
jgi:hypothetical protein